MTGIITPADLKAATGYERTCDIEKCLRKNGVRFLYGKTGIYTTIDALNAAMGLKSGAVPGIDVDIEIL